MTRALRTAALCRQPVPIEIAKSNIGLRVNVTKARDSTLLYLGDGPCSMIKAAHTGMDVDQVVDNLLAVSDAVAHRIPGKWENVQGEPPYRCQCRLWCSANRFARLVAQHSTSKPTTRSPYLSTPRCLKSLLCPARALLPPKPTLVLHTVMDGACVRLYNVH